MPALGSIDQGSNVVVHTGPTVNNSGNLPAVIFGNATALHIHRKNKFGDRGQGSRILQYVRYEANPGANFDIYAPVKCSLYRYWADTGESGHSGGYGPGSQNLDPEMQNKYTVVLKLEETVGMFKAGGLMAFESVQRDDINKTIYERGDKIGTTNNKFIRVRFDYTSGRKANSFNWSIDPDPIVQSSLTAAADSANATTGTGSSGGVTADIGSIAKAAAFSTFFTMPGLFDTIESTQLTGQKSLMNDQPLMPFVQQLSNACLRHFMSTPSGDFFAFYPDYFGGFGKAPYWYIEDIEIVNGSIDLSDDQLATHVYVVGDIVGPPSGAFGSSTVDMLDRIETGGVVTVFNAFMADFLNGTDVPAGAKVDKSKYPTLADKASAIAFLQKYGARPYYEEQPTVRAPIYESFLAYQKFCLKWSEQFKTQFEFTFMPELFPGGIVAFPSHGLQCYVNSVTHNCSYENGFTTTAELSAPSAYKANGRPVDPDKSWVHAGMIRAWPVDPNVGTFEGATSEDPEAQDKKGKSQKKSGTVKHGN